MTNEKEGILKICINDKKKEIFIPYESRFLNTLVIGNKGTGKSSLILKDLAYQTIIDRNVGGTFVVSSKDLSYELYTFAKNCKRRIVFINPSVSNEVDLLLNGDEFEKDDLSKIYTFEKFIYNNYIVIIDIENAITKNKGIQFVKLLLELLEDSMSKSDITCSRPHYLYVDDAFYYLDSLENILYYGNEYNLATTLFFQNRNQFKTRYKDFTSFIDSNVGNTIITNNLNHDDAKYYSEILDINLTACAKGRGKIFYELKNKDGAKINGYGEIRGNEDFNNIVYEELYSVKRALKKKKEKDQKKINTNTSKDNLKSKKKIKKIEPEKVKEVEKTKEIFENTDDQNENISIINNSDQSNIEISTNRNSVSIFNSDIFDDGKIELSLDWDDDF